MRQAVTTAIREVRVGESPEPAAPGAGEALLEIAAVGICGSDIAMWNGSDPYASFPIRQGHEFSGRVSRSGRATLGRLRLASSAPSSPCCPTGSAARACAATRTRA